jgi:predicted ATPase/DNA-binding winged helix-turn-helix (wHTH) protein
VTTPELGGSYRFGSTIVDHDAISIEHDGHPVAVEPQVFAVLVYLIEHRSRVVSKEELLDNVWGDRFVSESALTSRIKSARKAIGDNGRLQESIRTVQGHGYQFIAPLLAVEHHREEPITTHPERRSAPGIMAPQTELLGRAPLIDKLTERVGPAALVSLIGPAGVGKTHLARHIGASLSDRFPAGSWFVPLADVRQPSAVADAILDAIGATRSTGVSAADALVSNLCYREGLLVLDNCEHVLSSVAELVRSLRSAGATLAILTTTRQRLGVAGERLIPVPVLDPDAAIELFVDRVARHDVKLDPASPLVRQICDRLDHLPLALELVSAHTWALGLTKVAELLDDRMRLFEDSAADDDHHRTLEQAIASSYEMLDPSVQEALCQFGVFAGPFDLNAAMALSGSVAGVNSIERVNHLVALAEASLLVVEDLDDAPAYRLLESVRLFASERMSDRPAVELAHLQHFCERAEETRQHLLSGESEIAFADFGRDWDNYRAAVIHGLGLGEVELVRRLLHALVDYADMTQQVEHADWAEQLLAVAAESPDGGAADGEAVDLGTTRAGLARLLQLQDLDRTRELLDGVAPENNLSAALASTFLAVYAGDLDRAASCIDAIRVHVHGTGGLVEATAEGVIAFLHTAIGQDPSRAHGRLQDIAATGGPITKCHARMSECFQVFFEGDIEQTLQIAAEMIERGKTYGLELIVLASYRLRDQALVALDNEALLAEKLRDAIEHYRLQGHWTAVFVSAPLVAKTLIDRGEFAVAAKILAFYNETKIVGSRSQPIADLCALSLRQKSDELAAILDHPPDMAPNVFADHLIAVLTGLASGSQSAD